MKDFRNYLLLLLAAALIALLSGCGSTPDTVEDPLGDFSVEEVLPFATTAPEIREESTATPAPTSAWQEVSPVEQEWQKDRTVPAETPEPATPRPAQPAATAAGYQSLSYGDTGSAVRNLQSRLKSLGYYSGTVDGAFGSETVTAVQKFQSMVGMNQSGIASVNLQKQLYADSAPEYRKSADPVVTATPVPVKTPTYTLLARGDTGARVTKLQSRLRELGYYSGSVDGDYGSATVNAVKKFQQALGMTADGTATAALQKKLYASSAPAYQVRATATPTPTEAPEYVQLSRGASGTRVARLQSRLKALGYYTGSVDGVFGSGTVSAVKRFEAAYGRTQTGIATVALQEKLFSASAKAWEEPEEQEDEEEFITLSPGDSGTRVKQLQKRLKQLGYFTGEVKGNYLTLTTAAVKRFQKAIGVKQTGIATVALQKKLFSSAAPVYDDEEEEEDPDGYVELRRGDKGEAVFRLQDRLHELGYLTTVTYDGSFGARTEQSIKKFEARYGRKQTGVATIELQKKLFSSSALPYEPEATPTPKPESAGYTTLKQGDVSDAVKKMQKRLRELGFYEGAVNGRFGERTAAAVKRFQKAIGLKQTGTATAAVQEALYDPDAPFASSPTPAPSPEPTEHIYEQLSKGSKGKHVTKLQNRLRELGYFTSRNDYKSGTFDNATRNAVVSAELARGRESDGVADQSFLVYIYSDEAWLYAPVNSEGG